MLALSVGNALNVFSDKGPSYLSLNSNIKKKKMTRAQSEKIAQAIVDACEPQSRKRNDGTAGGIMLGRGWSSSTKEKGLQ